MKQPSLGLARLLLGICALAVSIVIIRGTHWVHQLGEAPPNEGYVVGPIRAGESAEQTFRAPGSYLQGINVEVRPHKDSKDPIELQFRLTQVDDNRVVREGRQTVHPDSARLRQTVAWRFELIPESAGRRYAIAVIPDAATAGHIFLPISLEDPLEGVLVTNGIATLAHNDLLLGFVRRADGKDVIRALLLSRPTVVIALLLIPSLALWILIRITRFIPSALIPTLGWGPRSLPLGAYPNPRFLSLTIPPMTIAESIRLFSDAPQPETNPWFWIAITTAIIGPGIVLVAMCSLYVEWVRVSARAQRIDQWIHRTCQRLNNWMNSKQLLQTAANGINRLSASAPPLHGAGALIANPIRRIEHWLQQGIGPGFRVLRDHMLPVAKRIDPHIYPERPFGHLSRPPIWWAVLTTLLVLAIAVRALAFMSHEYTPWIGLGGGSDGDTHLRLAARVITDPGFALGAAVYTKNDTALLIPGSVLLFTILGFYRGLLVFGWLQILLVSTACVGLAVIVARLSRSRVAGITAGLLLALHPIAIQYSIEFMSDGMGILLFILTMGLFFASLRNDSLRLNLAFGVSAALLLADRNTGWAAPLLLWMGLFLVLKLRPFANRRTRPPPIQALRSLTPLLAFATGLGLVEFFLQRAGAPVYLQTGTAAAPANVFPAFGLDPTHHSLLDLLGAAIGLLDVMTLASLLSLASRIPHFELLALVILVAIFLAGWTTQARFQIRLAKALIPVLTTALVWPLGLAVMASDRWANVMGLGGPGDWLTQFYLDTWVWNGTVFTAALISLFVVSPLFRLAVLAIFGYLAQAVLAHSSIFVAHPRLDLPLIIVFYFGVGIALGLCSQRLSIAARTSTSWLTGLTRRSLALGNLSILTWVSVITVIGVITGGHELLLKHERSTAYFTKLGSSVAEDSIILTSGHIDPWMAHSHLGRSTVYDAFYQHAIRIDPGQGFNGAYLCEQTKRGGKASFECLLEAANAPPTATVIFADPSRTTREVEKILRGASTEYLHEATLRPIDGFSSITDHTAWVINPTRAS